MQFKQIIGAIFAVTAVEILLILLGVLPSLSEASLGNTLFLLARAVIIGYSGWVASGFKNAAKNGAIVTAVGTLTLFIGAFVGFSIKVPVLGIQVYFVPEFFLMLFVSLIINILIGMVFSCFGYLVGPWLANRFKSNPKKSKKKK